MPSQDYSDQYLEHVVSDLCYYRLTIANAIQLIIAITSNMFLLLNMAGRVRFSLAQPITIGGWYYTKTT
jgi:hypothetical protein